MAKHPVVVSLTEKVGRLISIEWEKNNEEICDYTVSFDTVDEAVEKLLTILQ